jgi:hypothetical protein
MNRESKMNRENTVFVTFVTMVLENQYQELKVTDCSEIEPFVDSHPVFVGHLCLWYTKIQK